MVSRGSDGGGLMLYLGWLLTYCTGVVVYDWTDEWMCVEYAMARIGV